MDDLDPGGHPDLRDQRWARRAERNARKYLRKQRRRAFFRRNSNKFVSVIALVVIVGLLGLLYRDGMLDRFLPKTNPFAAQDGTWHVDLNQPFQTTPAAGWADGAAGIVIPDAPAIGSHSAETVKATMEQVRQVIIAARLDRRMLEGHDAEPYLSLLAPQAAAQMRPDFAPGREPETATYASKIADGYHLLPVEPKVNGTMSAELGKDGRLLVRADYSIAYAFRPDHPEAITDAMLIVGVDRWEDSFGVLNGRNWPKDAWGIWPSGNSGASYSMSCVHAKKGFIAPWIADRVAVKDTGEDPKRYFDPSQPVPSTTNCPR